MIVIQLAGGLGNQMFQYAYGKALSAKLKVPFYIDASLLNYYPSSKYNTQRQYTLDIFDINTEGVLGNDIWWLNQVKKNKFITIFLYKLYIKKLLFSNKLNVYEQTPDGNPEEWMGVIPNTYIKGSFQSEIVFKDIETEIHKDFTFQNLPPENIHTVLLQIRGIESVAIHIRRGDYTLQHNKEVHGVLGLEYYKKAILLLLERVKNPVFFVFSDDIDWVKENLRIDNIDIRFFENLNAPDYEDLRMMSNCKHNIIANSSFSWWGAWLNQNSNKIVIAPSNWFVTQNKDLNHLIPKAWIQL
jgi:Glycosyl transferase family 11